MNEREAFEAWFKEKSPVGGVNAKLAARDAWLARAAIEADRAQRVPDGWALVPIEPDDALMRPFYACPPDELSLAWRAMHMVAAKKSRGLASTPAPAQQEQEQERRPMTREQVRGLMETVGYESATPQEKADFINGIRHAERHHGIRKD